VKCVVRRAGVCDQSLDESGGSLLSSSSSHSSVAESGYHASVDDLHEFVRQCYTTEVLFSRLC